MSKELVVDHWIIHATNSTSQILVSLRLLRLILPMSSSFAPTVAVKSRTKIRLSFEDALSCALCKLRLKTSTVSSFASVVGACILVIVYRFC